MHFEIVRQPQRRMIPQVAVFDFDGTVSVIREGWQTIMIDMMVARLMACESSESKDQVAKLVSDFVMELTGKPTIYQMIRFVEELAVRGDDEHSAEYYLDRFQNELGQRINSRKDQMRTDSATAPEHRIPFVEECLAGLQAKNLSLYLLSGTEKKFVEEEIELLQIHNFFDDRIHGPDDDPDGFSKRLIIQSIIDEHQIEGDQLISFGDGVVEIEATVAVDGLAIGIAGDEAEKDGRIDPFKRQRLIDAGAHVIVADFRDYSLIEKWLYSTSVGSST